MDKSKSPIKSGKQFQPRGTKPLSNEKSNKESPSQREGIKAATQKQETLTVAKEEHTVGSRGPGKTLTDIPQDRRRGRSSRLTRLTGRTSSGERGKGKLAGSHQQLVAQVRESRVSFSADSSPSTNRVPISSTVPGTLEKSLNEQAKASFVAPAKDKSHGDFSRCSLFLRWFSLFQQVHIWSTLSLLFVELKAAALMHQSVEKGTEVRPTVEEGPLTEQQLGLRQAEERLHRDYIHRLLKVRTQACSHYTSYNGILLIYG